MRLKIGDIMPDMPVGMAYGSADTLYKVINGKKTLFWVVRYIGCPVCRYDTHCLAQRYEKFKEAGANVVVVMQSDPQVLTEVLKDEKPPFDIICDPQAALYKALDIKPAASPEEMRGGEEGLKKLQKKKEECSRLGYEHGKYEGDEMQLPAVFAVDGNAVVRFARYGEHLTDLPDYDEMVEFMRNI